MLRPLHELLNAEVAVKVGADEEEVEASAEPPQGVGEAQEHRPLLRPGVTGAAAIKARGGQQRKRAAARGSQELPDPSAPGG